MGEFQQLKALYMAKGGSTSTRYWVYPRGAGGTPAAPSALGTVGVQAISDTAAATWVWSAYVTIELITRIPSPCWLVGVLLHNFIVDVPFNGDFAIATGVIGSEVDIAVIPAVGYVANAAGEGVYPPIWLPFPIRIDGSPRLSVRVRKLTGANAAGATLKVILCTGLGT